MSHSRASSSSGNAVEDRAVASLTWARENLTAVIIGAVVVVAGIVGISVARRSAAIKETRAEQALFAAQQSFTAGNLPLAQSDLQKMLARYDGTRAADQASLLLAQIHYQAGQVDSGLVLLGKMTSAGPEGAAVDALRAAGLETQNKLDDAAAAYQAAAQKAGAGSVADGYRAEAARVLATAGKKDEALAIWRELANDEESFYAAEAHVRIGELTATVAGTN
ncbi:MAG TPA: tetratricopeptide repeat protein [Gemmatimonadaceae bacterium]|nr:tetratricopeptide repeat protein [Gemmatimonadaceae bacterium]